MAGERAKAQRARLKDGYGKVINIYLTNEAAGAASSIIELLSAKDDRLTMRDAVSLALVAAGEELSRSRLNSKMPFPQRKKGRKKPSERSPEEVEKDRLDCAAEKKQHEEYRAAWTKKQKDWRARLVQVRANYEKIPRGRRPAGWTPTPLQPRPSQEEEQIEIFQAMKAYDQAKTKKS
jgi:hypothetical protein